MPATPTAMPTIPASAHDYCLLRAHELTKTFTAGAHTMTVLNRIDLYIAEGEFIAVMGPSGSGKSTLLHCLSGIDRPSSGTVHLDGAALHDLSEAERARLRLTRMGFVFQQPYFLDKLTVRDNILLPALKAAPGRTRDAIARADGLMDRFGIGALADHRITEVSGGQLQRAALCRALATTPRILFADEPTGALNRSTGAEVMNALSEVHQEGTTIVLITHSPALAARADRVAYLQDGILTDSLDFKAHDIRAAHRDAALQDWLRDKGY